MRKRAWLVSSSLVALAGCNALLTNEDRLLDDTSETMPRRTEDRDGGDGPTTDHLDGGAAANLDADAEADAPPLCPAPTCITSADCAPNELCLGVADGVTDGGPLTRYCGAACDAGSGCASDMQCAGAQSPMTMHCAPKRALCGRACNFLCGPSCVDLSSDKLNCGACGNACPIAKSCTGGTCS